MPITQDLDKNIPTIIALVLDESGSMGSKKKGTIDGFNEFLQGLKTNENVYFSLTKFSSRGTTTIAVPLQEVTNVPELNDENYTPSGGTALLDATMKTIQSIEERSKELGLTTAPRFLVVVLTDGGENDSQEFSFDQVKTEIEAKEKTGDWTFVYLAESLDQWNDSTNMGFGIGNTYSTFSRASSRGINVSDTNAVYNATMQDVLSNTRVYMSSSLRSSKDFMNLDQTVELPKVTSPDELQTEVKPDDTKQTNKDS